jgi:hypothetical protein
MSIKNNNPANIQKTAIIWRGMIVDQNSESNFVAFRDEVWGIRALIKILLSYHRQGASTIRQIAERWAENTKNESAPYIVTVSRTLDAKPDATIDLTSPSVLLKLAVAIIRQENGQQPYSIEVIARAVKYAIALDEQSA